MFAKFSKRRKFTGTKRVTAKTGQNRTAERLSRRKLHIPACPAREHNGALSSSGFRGCAFRARRRIPVWVPPGAEGPPGPGKLQFPACPATGAPAYGRYHARERLRLKRCVSSRETRRPAAAQRYRETDRLWGEAAGPWAGEPGKEVRGSCERVSGLDKATIVSRWQFSLALWTPRP